MKELSDRVTVLASVFDGGGKRLDETAPASDSQGLQTCKPAVSLSRWNREPSARLAIWLNLPLHANALQ